MLAAIEARLAALVRRAIFGLVAVLLACAGIAVLAAAGWIALAQAYSHLVAALAIGGGLLLLALLAALAGRPRRRAAPAAVGAAQRTEMVQAFLAGLSAGVRARRRPPPPPPAA